MSIVGIVLCHHCTFHQETHELLIYMPIPPFINPSIIIKPINFVYIKILFIFAAYSDRKVVEIAVE